MIPNLRHVPPKRLFKWLKEKGADKAEFQDRSALEHYTGTYSVLKDWNNTEDICNAGLFHGIYMDAYFKGHDATQDYRAAIRSLIGEKSEALAYLHCAINRRKFIQELKDDVPSEVFDNYLQTSHQINHSEIKALSEMIWANAFEQFYVFGVYPEERELHFKILNDSMKWVSEGAKAAFDRKLSEWFKSG